MPVSDEVTRRFAFRNVAIAVLGIVALLFMLLTSDQIRGLRAAFPPLSRAMSWLDHLPLPLDMDHVVFFVFLAATLRLLLPRVQWWRLLVALGLLAVGTEVLQFGTVGRTPKLLDARDDLIGACIGLLISAGLLRFSARLRGSVDAK